MELLKSNEDLEILKNGSLWLKNLTKTSIGVYMCLLGNGIGTPLKHRASLRISCKYLLSNYNNHVR